MIEITNAYTILHCSSLIQHHYCLTPSSLLIHQALLSLKDSWKPYPDTLMLLQISLELLHIDGYDVLTLGILGSPLLDGCGAFYFPLAPWLSGFVGTHLYVVGGQLLV